MSVYDFTVKDRNGNDVALSKYRGKTLLIVNTATDCFLTPQYEALEKLYKEMQERDFEILDFPCSQFGNQLKPTMNQVHNFCTGRFGITFEQFDKVDVNGENAHPLFKYLEDQTKFEGFGFSKNAIKAELAYFSKCREDLIDRTSGIRWNFTKFLIDKNGEVVARFEPSEPIELVRQEVNRLLNGEQLSKRLRFSRIEKDKKTNLGRQISKKRIISTILFAIVTYIILFFLDLWIMQRNGIDVFRDGFLPEYIAPTVDEGMREQMKEIFENTYQVQDAEGLWDRIFLYPMMIYRQLLLPIPAVVILTFFYGMVNRMSLKKVNKLCAALEQASEGNFNYRLKTSEQDIFYRPFSDYNKMTRTLKETVNNLELAAAEAAAASEAKSNFLSNMSHEIRTPLNAVLGMDEMIIRESREEEIVNYALDIRNAGKILLSLINDILDFSKIEANKLEIIPVEYDLSSVINDLVNMTTEKVSAKGLEMIVDVDEDMPHMLKGDEIRIKQVCLNILNNAIKYTEKGTVKMSFRKAEKDGENAIRFICQDTGQGIRAEDIPKLTEPFARIDEKKNRSIEGTGLGMSITTNLLDMMGSKLELESEFGKGSTFSFTVVQPTVTDEPIGDFASSYKKLLESHEKYVEKFHAKDAKILVVDDVEMNLTVAKNFLKKTMVQVDTCTSGRQAIELATNKKYHIIFVDHMMPDMDGIETMNTIKNGDGPNKDTPIVVLTANAVSGAREKYIQAGFDEYLTKPIESKRLEILIQNLLPPEMIEQVYVTIDEAPSAPAELDENIANRIHEIEKIDGVDIAEGIANSGDEEAYVSVVENFGNTAAKRISLIREYWETHNYKDYTIQVHALKSSARLVGDMTLSELAKYLEECGNSANAQEIDNNTRELLDRYQVLADKINEIFVEDDTDKELIDMSLLQDGMNSLYEALQVFDMDMADNIIATLNDYRMPDSFSTAFNEMKILLSNVDRDAVLALLDDNKDIWR